MDAESIRTMSEQLADDPTSLVFLPLAEALLARGELPHALRVARRGADRHVHRADVHDLVARIALAMDDETSAERAWQTSLAIASEFGAAHRGLGFLCYRQGRWEDAESHLSRARAATPGDPALESAWRALQAARREAAQLEDAAPSAPLPAAADAHASGTEAAWDGATLFDAILGESAQVALLLDNDGLVVAGRYETADGTELGSVIGAHLSGVGDEATRAMRHFGLGAWTRMQLESEAATIVMAPAESGVTLVAAPREVPLGFVRRTLDRCVVHARVWLGGEA
jgi:predicted regulator of Ras-like GTPase activity (Roadblock/LC7/MglB family)